MTDVPSPFTRGEWDRGVVAWTDESARVAFLSVPFTWRLPAARDLALLYREAGYEVRAGGPGTFARKTYLADVAAVGGSVPDAIARHNPSATRASYGCPVACPFCIVTPMDGREFTYLPDFPVRPVLCDDNLSALPVEYQDHIVARYRAAGVPLLDANSGFAPDAFDEGTFARWRPVLRGPWRFGFDETKEGAEVERVFRILRDVPARRKQVYVMIGREPFDLCMDRIRRVIGWGGEPYVQPFVKLSALEKVPDVRFDWTLPLLRRVQRWVNRHLAVRGVPFDEYDPSAKTSRRRAADGDPLLPPELRA